MKFQPLEPQELEAFSKLTANDLIPGYAMQYNADHELSIIIPASHIPVYLSRWAMRRRKDGKLTSRERRQRRRSRRLQRNREAA